MYGYSWLRPIYDCLNFLWVSRYSLIGNYEPLKDGSIGEEALRKVGTNAFFSQAGINLSEVVQI
jgi:hypothetical protein